MNIQTFRVRRLRLTPFLQNRITGLRLDIQNSLFGMQQFCSPNYLTVLFLRVCVSK